MKPTLTTLLSVLIILSSNAQSKENKKIKFGEVTSQDFEPNIYPIDSAAHAIILYDAGKAVYEGNSDSWFSVVYTYQKRIRLLNKNAFDEATITIPLYKGNNYEDNLTKMEAYTYNIEDGKVVKTKIDKQSIFSDKVSKDFATKKFTFPNIKEGCIIEYIYTIVSPIANNLRGWTFQDRYPVLNSAYEVTIPSIFDFVFLNTGYYNLQPAVSVENKGYRILVNANSATSRSEVINYNGATINSKWILNDLPAITPEKFTTAIKNHTARVEFQLKSINMPNEPSKPILRSWDELATELLKDEQFGADLNSKNNWLDDDINKLLVANNDLQTAKNIYSFVQQNFICTDYDAKFMAINLKKAYQAKKGNVAEINLVLTAMLKKARINADPVLLSTRENGVAVEQYPLINRFNYVITRAVINTKELLLDASNKKMGFNHLPQNCYNGTGRIIADKPYLVQLSADSLQETKTTNIFIGGVENSDKLNATFSSTLGYYESCDLRETLTNTSTDDYFKKIKSGFTYDVTLNNSGIDSLNNFEQPIKVKYELAFNFDEDIVYYNPLMNEAYKTNPFMAAKRNYPVEMPYSTNEIINFSMQIPKGYKVDELPKSSRVKLNGDEGIFEYLIQADEETILLRSRIAINTATFSPEDYETLRNFYNLIVNKQSEQIVFKKIK